MRSRTKDLVTVAQALKLYTPEAGHEWELRVYCSSEPYLARPKAGGHEWRTNPYAKYLGTLRLVWGENQEFELAQRL